MRKVSGRVLQMLVSAGAAAALLSATAVCAEEQELVTDITLATEAHPLGQFAANVKLTVSDPAAVENVKAEDFSIVVDEWRSWNGIPQEPAQMESGSAVTEVALEGNVLTLTFGKFPERYYLMDAFTVNCASNEGLSFTMADIDTTINPALDVFTFVEDTRDVEGTAQQFNYYRFDPESAEEARPLVIYIHGFTETWTPLANRWAVTFTEDYVQSNYHPYVLVPQFEDNVNGSRENIDANMVIDEIVKVAEQLVAEGKVDPDRIYVAGKSMGGGNTYNAICRHADKFAGAIIACAAGRGYEDDVLIPSLAQVPSWILYSESDSFGIVKANRSIYDRMVSTGNDFATNRKEVKAEEVIAGFEDSPHHIELLATESRTYIDWLFAQRKSPVSDTVKYAKAHAKVTAEGTVIDSISLLKGTDAPSYTVNDTEAVSVGKDVVTVSGLNLPLGSEFTVTDADGNTITNADIRAYEIDTADEFMRYSSAVSNGYDFDYDMYVPSITPGNGVGGSQTRPAIIVLNDGEDVLLDNRGVTAWADQAVLQAYVIAPSLNAENAVENTLSKLQRMMDKDLIDDIYVTGTSSEAIVEFAAGCEKVKGLSCFTLEEMAADEDAVVNALLAEK